MPTPDVRVRLSAEGVKEVTDALKRISDEANKQGKRSENAFSGLVKSFGGIRGIISKLATAVGAVGFTSLSKDAIDYADSVGKAAQKTGATAETLSVLRVGASTADVEVEVLDKALIKLAVSMEELRQGTESQTKAFAQLGLKAEDLEKLDTGQVFVEIAKRLGGVQDGYRKTAIATDLFGKSGAQLIPLLNDLSEDGFAKLTEKAQELGLIVSQETALLAQDVNDSFTEIKNQVKGLALQFMSGLLPSIKATMDNFKEETEGKGVSSMKRFGQEAGRILRTVAQAFRLFETIVTTSFKAVGNTLGGLAAAIAAAFRGEFAEAGTILKETFGETTDAIREGFVEAFGELDKLVEEAVKQTVEIEVKPRVSTAGLADIETDLEKAAREKREKEEERARQKREREEEALARKREAARAKLGDIEVALLEAEGKRHEAFEKNLQTEVEEIKKLMDTLGVAAEEQQAFIDRFQNSQRGSFNVEELKRQFDSAMEALDAARERIQRSAEAGLITQYQAELQIRQLESERIPVLEQINTELQKQAGALGPEAVEDVKRYNEALDELQTTQQASAELMTQFKTAALEAGQQGLADMLKNIQKFKSAGDALKSVFQSIVQTLQNLLAEIIAKQMMMALIKAIGGSAGYKDGGIVEGFAEGGHVGGKGTGTSDSNLAWLSKGEFVVRAAVVSQPGMLAFLNALNGGARMQGPSPTPRFAAGGLNTGGGKTGDEKDKFRIINVLDPDLVTSALGTPAGEKVIMNTIQRNASGIRRFIGDTSR
jgi:hypothetical protein